MYSDFASLTTLMKDGALPQILRQHRFRGTLWPMFRCSWILLVIFFCPQCFGAEDGGCTQRTVIVTARDSSGKALPYTLQVADLRGRINDKPIQILAATKPTNPSRVALVLDASGSMSSKWQRAVEFALEIVEEPPSSTQFALVIFADNELRTVEFGKTGPEFITEIMSFKNVKPYGHTALRDGLSRIGSVSMSDRGSHPTFNERPQYRGEEAKCPISNPSGG